MPDRGVGDRGGSRQRPGQSPSSTHHAQHANSARQRKRAGDGMRTIVRAVSRQEETPLLSAPALAPSAAPEVRTVAPHPGRALRTGNPHHAHQATLPLNTAFRPPTPRASLRNSRLHNGNFDATAAPQLAGQNPQFTPVSTPPQAPRHVFPPPQDEIDIYRLPEFVNRLVEYPTVPYVSCPWPKYRLREPGAGDGDARRWGRAWGTSRIRPHRCPSTSGRRWSEERR